MMQKITDTATVTTMYLNDYSIAISMYLSTYT